jgi:hypothetical protein
MLFVALQEHKFPARMFDRIDPDLASAGAAYSQNFDYRSLFLKEFFE